MVKAFAKVRGMMAAQRIDVDPATENSHIRGHIRSVEEVAWDVPIVGTVYGALLNHNDSLAALGDAVTAPPYKAPPRAPILFVKPANTWIASYALIPLPKGVPALEINASLGVVIGRTACRVSEVRALEFVLGYTIVNDVCEPHASVYRPAIRQRCRDGFCAIGPWIVAKEAIPSPNALAQSVFVDGELRSAGNTAHFSRSIEKLIADVTEFMTLSEGDVLLLGSPPNPPLARVGDLVRIEIEGIGSLSNRVMHERRI